ncbi:MAG: hypothetical protein WKF83_06085 [Nocardioidaceae bacterium]
MSHGDFDYDYLTALTLDHDGRRRLDRVSFAAHFDMLMFGRRGIERPPDEESLHPFRKDFADMFARLQREHGVRSFLAHSMTVTPANVGQVADVVRTCHDHGYGMFSFQPAAFVGDDRRWHESYRDTTADQVWAEIERGAGTRLPYSALQVGDERCNRTAFGFYLGDRWFSILDDRDPADLHVRDAFYRYLGGVSFSGTPLPTLMVKLSRGLVSHLRSGGSSVAGPRAWSAEPVPLRWSGIASARSRSSCTRSWTPPRSHLPGRRCGAERACDDPRLAATQERLRACSYAMAHPETGELVPACVQHAVLDPTENLQLRRLLPLTVRTGRPATRTRAGDDA